MQIEGRYMDGTTSSRHYARLEVSSYHPVNITLVIEPDIEEGARRECPLNFDEMKVSSRLGNTPREIAFGDNELFVTDDNDAVDEFVRGFKGGGSASFLHRMENSLTMILGATAVTILMIWAAVVYGIPSSAHYIAHQLPDFTSEKLGSGLTMLDETIFSPSELHESEQYRYRAVMAPYLEPYEDLGPKIEFRSGMPANAFALPGGEIVFTDDFLKLVESDEELIAVLFHELGHLKHKHITRRVLQDSMITLMVIFITGDIDTIDLLTGLPTLMLDLSYSRSFELEADQFALDAMQISGISAKHFASIMQKLDKSYADHSDTDDNKYKAVTDFLSTHPPTEQRIKLAEQYQN
ncbi:M48 family metallopeptidase [Alkalimarinus coralli]|uniref:M48 family metallopeptidase n=1 Tax=Alkalimarinus coralli TaxID=2935863 RepID=UPI00202B262D|nr:M48 family metallopeptidase [Alkalimarinus coralli]